MNGELIHGDCIEKLKAMPIGIADLVIGSPPYALKGRRYANKATRWPVNDWIEWMACVTEHAVNVTNNVVVWIVNGAVQDGAYQPAVEGLIWRMYQEGFACERPAIWHKNAPPNRLDWFGNDWEYCIAFRPANSTRRFDYKQIATPPKYNNGGHFRQRGQDGKRRRGGDYPKHKLTRPRDVLRVLVGGGHMGSKLAHLNVAPFPEGIVEPFIKTCCKRQGLVIDPFCGSGTTCAVAQRLGRRFIGIDSDATQIALSQRRLEEVLCQTVS
jgi:DNA modification methylase